jgi:hypothetical protein
MEGRSSYRRTAPPPVQNEHLQATLESGVRAIALFSSSSSNLMWAPLVTRRVHIATKG